MPSLPNSSAVLPEDWHEITTHVVRDIPEYRFALEEWRNGDRQMVFVHMNVREWTKAALKQMLHEFKIFRKCVTCPLYAVAGEDAGDKWEDFVALFGFSYLTDVICNNGESRRLFWLPNEKNNEDRQDQTEDVLRRSEEVQEPEEARQL